MQLRTSVPSEWLPRMLPLSYIRQYVSIPFDDEKWKVRRFSRNFYSLLLVVCWVQNFSNFWDISIVFPLKRYVKFSFSFFLTVRLFENLFSQKVQCLQYSTFNADFRYVGIFKLSLTAFRRYEWKNFFLTVCHSARPF